MEKHDDSNLEEAHESEFDQIMSKAVRDILEGNITPDAFLKLARSRDADAVRYAIRRMADPSLELWEEQILQRVVFQSGVVLQLIADLARKFPGPAEAIARTTLREAADHHGLHIRTEDAPLVMRALAEVQEMPQTLGTVAFLFALLNADAPQIQSKAASLIQKADSDLQYTWRLVRHPAPRVRSNTLEALLEFKDLRAIEHFRSCAADTHSRVRSVAAVGLCRSGDPSGWEILTRLVCSPLIPERRSGVWALGMCGNREHLCLLEFLERSDRDQRVRQLAVGATEKIRGTKPAARKASY